MVILTEIPEAARVSAVLSGPCGSFLVLMHVLRMC